MKNKMKMMGMGLGLGIFLGGMAGCSSTNTQQIANSTSGDGVRMNASVPISGTTAIGLQVFVGRFNTTTLEQPTSTNKVYAPALAVVVTGQGKQSANGSGAGTNGTAASLGDASRDASVIVTGPDGAADDNGSNAVLSVSSGGQ